MIYVWSVVENRPNNSSLLFVFYFIVPVLHQVEFLKPRILVVAGTTGQKSVQDKWQNRKAAASVEKLTNASDNVANAIYERISCIITPEIQSNHPVAQPAEPAPKWQHVKPPAVYTGFPQLEKDVENQHVHPCHPRTEQSK